MCTSTRTHKRTHRLKYMHTCINTTKMIRYKRITTHTHTYKYAYTNMLVGTHTHTQTHTHTHTHARTHARTHTHGHTQNTSMHIHTSTLCAQTSSQANAVTRKQIHTGVSQGLTSACKPSQGKPPLLGLVICNTNKNKRTLAFSHAWITGEARQKFQ